MRAETLDRVNAPLRTYFEDVRMQANDSVEDYCDKLKEQISSEIDRYLITYQRIVTLWIRIERAHIVGLEKKLQQLQDDMNQIDFRRQSLESVRRQIEPSQEVLV